MRIHEIARVLCIAACAAGASASGPQPNPVPHFEIPVDVDSGWVNAPRKARAVTFATVVGDEDAAWLRLRFGEVVLGAAPTGGSPTLLRITSLLDGGVQTMQQHHVEQWRNTSAYFNGPAVLVEIVSDPGAAPSRVVVDLAWMEPSDGGISVSSICGGVDDRVLVSDPRIARTMPLGCTAFMIDDWRRSFLTAGHCGSAAQLQTVQFNVPLSTPGGVYQHPGPEHQYAVDASSIQRPPSNSTGNDWTYFGVFANSVTGFRAYVIQGAWFTAQYVTPAPGGTVRVAGYGIVSPPMPATWNGVLTEHSGPYTSLIGTTIRHQVDTTGGNSGSPIESTSTGEVIGVHTNGGCDTVNVNFGTSLGNLNLQNAIANPLGECQPFAELSFSFPDGFPDALHPDGAVIRVHATGINGSMPQADSGLLAFDDGSGWVEIPMTAISSGVYDAPFPSMPCGTQVRFYFTVRAASDIPYTHPAGAPVSVHQRVVASSIAFAMRDDMEADFGWTVEDDAFITDGSWERGVPLGDGSRGDPTLDADGSSQCYLTANRPGNSDVDDGATTLISPVLDATHPDTEISYFRWFSNSAGINPFMDEFVVEVSDDGGSSWVTLEIVGPDGPEVSGGWIHRAYRVGDIPGITNTAAFRIRFIASDFAPASLVEAGVDAVELRIPACVPAIPGDVNGDGFVDFADALEILASWGPCPGCPADLDGSGTVDFLDLLEVLSNWS